MSGTDKQVVKPQVNTEELTELSFEELCSVSQVESDFVLELIEYGTIEPIGVSVETWRFSNNHLRIIRTAVRLHDDLEVNHAGIALAIDLMDQVEALRAQVEMLQKYMAK